MDRTHEEFRESSAAALAHAMMSRVSAIEVVNEETIVDDQVLVEAVPVKKTTGYRERRRFRT